MPPRILVQPATGDITEAKFTDCVLQLLGYELFGKVAVSYHENTLLLTATPQKEKETRPIPVLKHSPLCPFNELDQETIEREDLLNKDNNILVAVSVLAQSSDGHILLSRRPSHMRTFPGIWVTPGGHVDQGESLEAAVVRELQEETGLSIDLSSDKLSIVAMWESAYPHHLEFGYPTRHHIIIYFLCMLTKSREELQEDFLLDPNEVSLCAWLSNTQVNYIVGSKLDELAKNAPKCSVIEFNPSDGSQAVKERNVTEMFSFGGGYQGRISAGTMYALEQFVLWNDVIHSEHSQL